MDGQSPHFTKLPQETQWAILERAMLDRLMSSESSPCVQALALYALPDPTLPDGPFQQALLQDETLARNTELIEAVREGHDRDRLRFLFPNPAFSRYSFYSHAFELVELAPVLTAGSTQRFSTLVTNVLASGAGDNNTSEGLPIWAVDGKKRICVIDAIRARLTDEDKRKAVCPDFVTGADGPRGTFPVILNPIEDLLWLDFASIDDGQGPRRLAQVLETGVYNSHLIPVRQIAVDFDESLFRKVCERCGRLNEDYDAEDGVPTCICSSPRDGNWRRWRDSEFHHGSWCQNAEAVARIWPVTTPNLDTFYAIDRRIKLKPGASIPPGTRTFRGNGCIFAEVRESLWDGRKNRVWQYPSPRHGGATVFEFVRYLRDRMEKRLWEHRANIRSYRTFDPANFPDRLVNESLPVFGGEFVDSPQNWAIHIGRVPDCKILAIVEEAPTPKAATRKAPTPKVPRNPVRGRAKGFVTGQRQG